MEADIVNQIEGLRPVKGREGNYPYILFNKSPEQLRRLGACGGKANARNQRARRALVPTPLQPGPPRLAPGGRLGAEMPEPALQRRAGSMIVGEGLKNC